MRGKGVSKKLINAFIQSCREQKILKGLVTIDPLNEVSFKLFSHYFNKHSSFELSGELDINDDFCSARVNEKIYTFKI